MATRREQQNWRTVARAVPGIIVPDEVVLGDSATADIGTGTGDVAAGDHNHDTDYSALSHQHDASDINAGTLSTDRFSAYADLSAETKIGTGGTQVAAGDHKHDASDVNAGTLSTDRFSAYSDLTAETKIGTGSAQVAAGNHQHSAFDAGLIVNEAGGSAAGDDFRVESDNSDKAIFVDASADVVQLGNPTAGNYSEIEADGTLVFKGGATVWNDTMVPATAARTAAADLALRAFTGGLYAPRLDLNDEIFMVAQFPHNLKINGTVTIHPHIHLINQNAIGATGYNVACDLEWAWVNTGSAIATTTPESDVRLSFQNAAALNHKMLHFTPIVAGAGQGGVSSMFFCRIKRVAAGAEAYNTNDIFFAGFDIHYEIDTIGSRELTSK